MDFFDNSIFEGVSTTIPTENYGWKMPGDEMGPDQRPFNENWFNLDKKIKEIEDTITDLDITIVNNKSALELVDIGLQNSINAINEYTVAGEKLSTDTQIHYTNIVDTPTYVSEFNNDMGFTTAETVAATYATLEAFEELSQRISNLEESLKALSSATAE